MAPIHTTILHPTDFSDRSAHALRLACSLARDYGARLVVLHVAEPPPPPYEQGVMLPVSADLDEERADLERLAVPDDDVIRVERRFEKGDPAAVTLRVADELHADLIVMGTHGRTGLSRLLMGSVAEKVVRRATCPVLTVKTPLSPEEEEGAAADRPGAAARSFPRDPDGVNPQEAVMLVREVMTRNAACVRPNDTLQSAAAKMRDLNVGSMPVCGGEDKLVGMLTDRDVVIRSVAEGMNPNDSHVSDAMSQGITYCFEDQDVEEAAELMRHNQIRRLAVLNRDKRLVGIVSLGDLAVGTDDEHLAGRTLEEVSEPAMPTR